MNLFCKIGYHKWKTLYNYPKGGTIEGCSRCGSGVKTTFNPLFTKKLTPDQLDHELEKIFGQFKYQEQKAKTSTCVGGRI